MPHDSEGFCVLLRVGLSVWSFFPGWWSRVALHEGEGRSCRPTGGLGSGTLNHVTLAIFYWFRFRAMGRRMGLFMGDGGLLQSPIAKRCVLGWEEFVVIEQSIVSTVFVLKKLKKMVSILRPGSLLQVLNQF